MKWTCPGIAQRLEELEAAPMTPSIYRATKQLLSVIDAEMQDPSNSLPRLKAYRYRASKILESIR